MSRRVLPTAALGIVFLGCAHGQKVVVSQAKAPVKAQPVAAAAPEPRKPSVDDSIFFDFDSALIRDDARPVLQRIAGRVADATGSLRIEGNCDDVGTIEYNLALGEHRAMSAKEYLVHMGVPSGRIATVSYGAQRPKYSGHDADARAKNRRDDLLMTQMESQPRD